MSWYEDTSARASPSVDRFVEALTARYDGAEDDLDRLVEDAVDRAARSRLPGGRPPTTLPTGARPRLMRVALDASRYIGRATYANNAAERIRLLRRAILLVSTITRTLTSGLAAPRLPPATVRVIRAFVGYLGEERRAVEDAIRRYLGIREPTRQARLTDADHLNRLREAARRIPILTENALKRTAKRLGSEAWMEAGKRTPPVRPSAPPGWTGSLNAFGTEIGWPAAGKVKVPAEAADLAKLRRAGVTERWAVQQAQIYREVARLNPANPTATLRAEWLEKIAARLRGTS